MITVTYEFKTLQDLTDFVTKTTQPPVTPQLPLNLPDPEPDGVVITAPEPDGVVITAPEPDGVVITAPEPAPKAGKGKGRKKHSKDNVYLRARGEVNFDERTFTIDDTRTALSGLNEVQGLAACTKMLENFKVARLTELPPEKYKAFVEACQDAVL